MIVRPNAVEGETDPRKLHKEVLESNRELAAARSLIVNLEAELAHAEAAS